MGITQGLALGAKNEALKLLSVSTRTMIFATNVLAVMFIARIFGLEKLKLSKIVAALLLATGGLIQGSVTLQHWKTHGDDSQDSDQPLGYILAVLSLLLDAVRWVLLQAVLTQEAVPAGDALAIPANGTGDTSWDSGTTSQRVTMVTAASEPAPAHDIADMSNMRRVSWVMWMSTPVCLLLSLVFEPNGLLEAFQRPPVLGLVGLLTLGVTGINLAEFGVVEQTSAVTFNVLSQLHSIPMVIAGVIFFGEHINTLQVIGFAVCLVGAMLYSVAKAAERRSMMMQLTGNEHPAQAEQEQAGEYDNGKAAALEDGLPLRGRGDLSTATLPPLAVRRTNSNAPASTAESKDAPGREAVNGTAEGA